MSSYQRLVITTPESAVQFKSIVKLAESKEGAQDLINYLEGCLSGAKACSIEAKVGAVHASLAGTFTDVPSADETITINGVAFTCKDSGATGDQFNKGASVTAAAANLAAAINASTTAGIAGVVTATSALGVITITADAPGLCGNYVVADGLSNFTWAGSATRMTGGSDGTTYTVALGN